MYLKTLSVSSETSLDTANNFYSILIDSRYNPFNQQSARRGENRLDTYSARMNFARGKICSILAGAQCSKFAPVPRRWRHARRNRDTDQRLRARTSTWRVTVNSVSLASQKLKKETHPQWPRRVCRYGAISWLSDGENKKGGRNKRKLALSSPRGHEGRMNKLML